MKAILFLMSLFFIQFELICQNNNRPLDPYPVWGKVWDDSDSTLSDTIYIEACEIQALVNNKIIATGMTNVNGYYKLEFPANHYVNNLVIIRTNCAGYINSQMKTSLLTFSYPVNGQSVSFGLAKETDK